MNTLDSLDSLEHYPSRQYIDLNFSMIMHPVSEDVGKKVNEEAIKQAIKSLVLISSTEKPFHPEIAGNVYDMLFENFELPGNAELLRLNILNVLREHEPRIKVQDIDFVNDDANNHLMITIYFKILNTLLPSSVEFFIKTVR